MIVQDVVLFLLTFEFREPVEDLAVFLAIGPRLYGINIYLNCF